MRKSAKTVCHSAVWTIVLVWALLTGGCSLRPDAEALDCVPDSAVAVKTVNLDVLLREAGTPVAVKQGKLAEEAERVLSLVALPEFRDPLATLLASRDAVDFSRMTSFTTAGGRDVVILPVENATLLETALESAGGRLEHSDGLEFCRLGGEVAALDGEGLCWLASDLMTIIDARAGASRNCFGELTGVKEFLSGDGAVNVAINCGNSMISFLGGRSRWLCVSVRVTPQSVSAIGEVMDRDGRRDSVGGSFEELNPDFLRYTPADASVVLAYGRFHGNERGLSMLLGRFAPMYLDDADGTTALWAMPVSGNAEAVAGQAPGSWSVATMVHVPQEDLREGLKQYMDHPGGDVSESYDEGLHQWQYTSELGSYYFGAFDGSLIFSTNRPISDKCENDFSDDFFGRRAAMVIDIPSGGVLAKAWGLPYGLTFKIGVDPLRWKMRVSFNGTGMSAFKALLNMPQLPDLHARAYMMAGM